MQRSSAGKTGTPIMNNSTRTYSFVFLFILLTFPSFYLLGQTTFLEKATSQKINLDGSKDGGFTFADFNADGYLDLLVNTNQNDTSHRSRLYFSDGPPSYKFTDVTTTHAQGLIASGQGGGATMERCGVAGDLDNDGDIDFIRNTSTRFELYLNNGAGSGYTFGTGVNQAPNFALYTPNSGNSNPPDGIPDGMNTEGIGFFDYDNDGDLDIMIENHNWGIDIYENNTIPSGTFSLTHVTPGTGFPLGLDQTAVDGDYSSVTDIDDDGYIDIIARKKDMEDFWRNNGDGTFSPVTWVDQQADNSNKGGVSLYDYDNDGDYDLFWTDNDTNQIWQQTGIGSGTFIATNEPATSSATILPTSGIDGLASGDVDNDGDIDLFLADNSDSSYLFINETPVGSTTLTFIRNNCNIDISGNAEGAAFVDYDRDGDLDLYVNVHNGENQLWENRLGNTEKADHLVVRVYENINNTIPNRDAIGANVILKDCSGAVVSGVREVNGGNGHGTQDPAFVHFGLPDGPDEIYIVEVHYPYLNGVRRTAQFKVRPSDLGTYHLLEIDPQSIVDNPVAENDNGGTIFLNQTADYSVLSNDYDADGDAFFISAITSNPASGTATIINSGTQIRYVNNSATGTFTITYQICETDCNSLCDEAELTITVIPESDYGDAPASYGDICYTINTTETHVTQLGSAVEGDLAMQYAADADADSDDGVTFVGGTTLNKGTTASVTFSWTTNDANGHIYAWMDFDRNGTFDHPAELIINNFAVGSAAANGATGTATVNYFIPDSAACGKSYARFTIQSDLASIGPTGTFCSSDDISEDGEVEDYTVTILGCVEICDNGVDDDGDLLVDCDDPDCYNGLTVDAGANQTACVGTSLSLSAAASGGDGSYTYTWNNGLGSGANKTVSPATTTTYRVTVTDGNGCTASDQVILTINSIPTATINGAADICPGETRSLSATNQGSGTSYTWNFGANASPTTASGRGPHTVTFNTCTNHAIQLIVERNACVDSTTTTISTIDNTDPLWTIAPENLLLECDQSANLNDSIALWLAADGGGTASDNCGLSISHNFSALTSDCGDTGNSVVQFTATDVCGNTSTQTATIDVVDTVDPVLPTVNDVATDCDNIPAAPLISATDACDSNPSIVFQEVLIQHPNADWGEGSSCSLLYKVSDGVYNDQGTPGTGDDEMSFVLTVIGNNTGSNWSTTIAGTPLSGAYYTSYSLGPFASNGPTLSFSIVDGSSAACAINVSVAASEF